MSSDEPLRPGSRAQLAVSIRGANRLSGLLLLLLMVSGFVGMLWSMPSLNEYGVLFNDSRPQSLGGRVLWAVVILGMSAVLLFLLIRILRWICRVAGCIQGFSCPYCHRGYSIMDDAAAVMTMGTCVFCGKTLFTDAERLTAELPLTIETITHHTKHAGKKLSAHLRVSFCLFFVPLIGGLLCSYYGIPSHAVWDEPMGTVSLCFLMLYLIVILASLFYSFYRMRRCLVHCPHCQLPVNLSDAMRYQIIQTGNCPRCGNQILIPSAPGS